jgi:adenylate kinase family enzyme
MTITTVERPLASGLRRQHTRREEVVAVDEWIKRSGRRNGLENTILLGRSGVGKTTTLVRLTEALIKGFDRSDLPRLPVFLDLASWTPGVRLEDWLVQEMRDYHTGQEIVQRWLREGSVDLVIDNISWLSQDFVADAFEQLASFRDTYPGVKIVLAANQEVVERHLPDAGFLVARIDPSAICAGCSTWLWGPASSPRASWA